MTDYAIFFLDRRVMQKENEKVDKYLNLARE